MRPTFRVSLLAAQAREPSGPVNTVPATTAVEVLRKARREAPDGEGEDAFVA
jgi:hypothetical protein